MENLTYIIFSNITTIFLSAIQFTSFLFFPGILLLFSFSDIKENDEIMQKTTFAVGTSLSYWIVGFSFLKFINIPHNMFIYISIVVSILIGIFLLIKKRKIYITIKRETFAWILFIGIISLSFLKIYNNQIVPTGADMATHTYTAKIIFKNNGYPTTHEPLVPISSFGFAPYGLSALSATISHISNIPIHRSSFIVAIFSYIVFYISLISFLLNYYSHLTTFITSFFIFFVEKNIITYLGWGGNTTILSIGILIIMVNTIIRYMKFKDLNYFSFVMIIALLSAGSFYTHQMPIIAFLYVNGIIYVLYAWKYKLFKKHFKYLLFLMIFTLFLLPFLTSYQKLTNVEVEHILSWQRNSERFSVIYNLISLFTSPIENIIRWHSDTLLILMIISICLSLYRKQLHSSIYLFNIIFLFIFLVNSNFWILPLSEIFYPDRLLTLSIIPISYFLGNAFSFIEDIIKIFNEKSKNLIDHLSFYLILYISFSFLILSYQTFFRDYVYWPTNEFTSVTVNDMKVFEWIKNNLPIDAVIENNYGDAGIWIPAIAERKVKVNDSNAHYLDELYKAQDELKPKFLFIGEKSVYENAISFKLTDVVENPEYIELYRSGNSIVLEKIKNNDNQEEEN